jgi:hypothetical protein
VRRTQVPVRDGEATLSLRWTLPTCAVVQRSGTPQVTLTLVGDERRPYLLDLVGRRAALDRHAAVRRRGRARRGRVTVAATCARGRPRPSGVTVGG